MRAKAQLLFMTLCFCKAGLLAQPYRDNVWVLGVNNLVKNRIIDFNFSQWPATLDSSTVGTPFNGTNTMICDTAGELLFYSNGVKVFNRTFVVMQNGSGLSPCPHSTAYANNGLPVIQSMIILPKPGMSNLYSIFHTSIDLENNPNPLPLKPGTIFYSEVDMNLANGMGALARKNDTLFRDTLVVVGPTAVRHANGRDWWLISHEWKTNQYYKWLVTPDSIYGPYSQFIGSLIFRSAFSDDNGMWTFSPDGTKFAIVSQPYDLNKKVDLFDFDRCTGLFSSFTLLTITDTAVFSTGCAFSSNSRYLYVGTNYFVYQFDTYSTNMQSSMVMVKAHDGGMSVTQPDYFSAMQTGPDGKIYINSLAGISKLHVIHTPDSAGLSCNVALRDFDLKNVVAPALPIYPNYALGSLQGSPCDTLTGITEQLNHKPLQLSVSPNPAMGDEVTVRYTLEQNQGGELKIENTLGQVVLVQKLPPWSSLQKLRLQSLGSGVYFIGLKSGSKRAVVKMVKTIE